MSAEPEHGELGPLDLVVIGHPAGAETGKASPWVAWR